MTHTEFSAVTTSIELHCPAGATLVLHHGVVVAVVGNSTSARATPTVAQARTIDSDACDAQLMAFINERPNMTQTEVICNSLGIAPSDKPMRSHIGQRLRALAKSQLIVGKPYGPAGRYWMFGRMPKEPT